MNGETVWQFKTARFTICLDLYPCDDLDLSWCETGETAANLESGLWQAFDSCVSVHMDGVEIASEWLGQSIYENPSDFQMEHIRGSRDYLKRRVRKEAAEFRDRWRYMQRKRAEGCSRRYYENSMANTRASAKAARETLQRIQGDRGYGAYFPGMVSRAIAEARAYLASVPPTRQ